MRTKRLRCKRAVSHLYAGRYRALGFSQARVYGRVLECYDQGRYNGPVGNRWDRWAANCRGDDAVYPVRTTAEFLADLQPVIDRVGGVA